jgi:hypothetical protein
MSKRVYGWEADPATDSFSFKLSNERADALVRSQAADFITLPCGRLAVQLRPRPSYLSPLHCETADSPSLYPAFALAWRIKPSGHMPVWQMRTQRA